MTGMRVTYTWRGSPDQSEGTPVAGDDGGLLAVVREVLGHALNAVHAHLELRALPRRPVGEADDAEGGGEGEAGEAGVVKHERHKRRRAQHDAVAHELQADGQPSVRELQHTGDRSRSPHSTQHAACIVTWYRSRNQVTN